jgi:hypothetical protein
VLSFAPSLTARPRSHTTVGRAGDGVSRVGPPSGGSLAAVRERQDTRLPLVLELRSPASPVGGFAGPGAELRRGTGLAQEAARRLAELDDGIAADGFEVAAGDVVLLTVPGAERDDAELRPAVAVSGGRTRIVALDTVGGVVRDVGLFDARVSLPPRTARVAVIGGGAPADGIPGWWAGSLLVQIGAHTLVGPGCTIESTAVRTRRGRAPASAAFVTAASAVAGLSVVTTHLPAGTRSLAIGLETGDPTGDLALELGITGAHAVGEPIITRSGGAVVSVYELERERGAAEVVVTVASGRDLHLQGVMGSLLAQAELAPLVEERRFAGLLGSLVPTPGATARVRWQNAAEVAAINKKETS